MTAIVTMGVAGVGGAVTDLGPWYYGLRQPDWKPPDLWFGPAWTLIFTLTAIAAARAWLRAPGGRSRRAILWAYGANGVLNVLWSTLFFMLLPYLLWVSFAATLNLAVVRLNGPF